MPQDFSLKQIFLSSQRSKQKELRKFTSFMGYLYISLCLELFRYVAFEIIGAHISPINPFKPHDSRRVDLCGKWKKSQES